MIEKIKEEKIDYDDVKSNSSRAHSAVSSIDSDDADDDDDGASSIAMSLTCKIKKSSSTDPTLRDSLLQQTHQQQQQQHQQQSTDFLQRQHQQQQHQQHQQQQIDEIQSHQQLTANLFMARTIALSRSALAVNGLDNRSPSSTTSAGGIVNNTNNSNNSGSSNYLLPCPLCDTPLEPRIFRQHLDRHYPRDSPVCPVLECGRRFAHPNSVRNHMRIKHTLQWAKMKAMRSSGGPFSGIQDYK